MPFLAHQHVPPVDVSSPKVWGRCPKPHPPLDGHSKNWSHGHHGHDRDDDKYDNGHCDNDDII